MPIVHCSIVHTIMYNVIFFFQKTLENTKDIKIEILFHHFKYLWI